MFRNLAATVQCTRGISHKSTGDSSCDAILHTRSKIGTREEIKLNAKNSLLKALKIEQLHVGTVKDKIWIGNSHGLDTIKHSDSLNTELASLRNSLASLEKRIASQKESLEKTIASQKESQSQIGSLRAEITTQDATIAMQNMVLELTDRSQETRLRALIGGNESYKRMRQRFLSTFKRDHLKKETEEDHRIIAESNQSAHGGDAAVDATLYSGPGARNDFDVFQILYGLSPQVIASITHEKTLTVLNLHAEVLGSDFREGTQAFEQLFMGFIQAFEKSKYDPAYLEGEDTEVTLAYRAFVNCLRTEVKKSRLPQKKP